MKYKLSKLFWVFVLSAFTSCSVSKFIPEGEYLLEDVEVISDNKDVKPSEFRGYVHQNPNSSWFSIAKVPLRIYALSGTDTTKWINRFIQKIGDEPVIYDSASAERSKENMKRAMQNLGYMQANVDVLTKKKKKKIELSYVLHPGKGYVIRSWQYDVKDQGLRNDFADYSSRIMSENMLFNVNQLNMERQNLATFFQNKGYYKFNKELITCTADTVSGSYTIDLNFHIAPYASASKISHQKYHIGELGFFRK